MFSVEVLAEDPSQASYSLFDDLALVEKIDREIHEVMPLFQTFSMVGGYFNMPSARMPQAGVIGLSAAQVTPYGIYAVSFQPLSRIELSLNYRVYNGVVDTVLGPFGFGDVAERAGNAKIAIIAREDGIPWLPELSFGAEDFLGTSRFSSQYVVMTKQLPKYNVEGSIGYGRGRLKGLFGGITWSPWRKRDVFFLKDVSVSAEWDAFDYLNHPHEHPQGRELKSRVNVGLHYFGWDMLQITLCSLRGTTLAGGASMRLPLGDSTDLFPKIKDPPNYHAPIDLEPLGIVRPETKVAEELSYAFSDQGLDLYTAHLAETEDGKVLFLKVVNNRYPKEEDVRVRIQDLLSALVPSDIDQVTVIMEADALSCQEYVFRTSDLQRFRLRLISEEELEVVSPRRDVQKLPDQRTLIFQRKKEIWAFTFRPRLLTFFGSSTGKFKYSLGLLSTVEGYFFDEMYYKLQVGYSIHSTMFSMNSTDIINPSRLINVRTDTLLYYQNNTFSLEKAYLQKGFNLKGGWFSRVAAGYFEPAYGGLGAEFLYYPADAHFAMGFEGAGLLKRNYKGIGFTTKARKLKGNVPTYVHFIGYQYFLDIYYQFKPLDLDFKVMVGSFLARDKGARFEVTRNFSSGFRFTLWYTLTNGHDKVNGRTYYDKGFAFSVPLDFFKTQSSRNYVNYAMSAWLRDVGAIAETGKQLYMTLREERFD